MTSNISAIQPEVSVICRLPSGNIIHALHQREMGNKSTFNYIKITSARIEGLLVDVSERNINGIDDIWGSGRVGETERWSLKGHELMNIAATYPSNIAVGKRILSRDLSLWQQNALERLLVIAMAHAIGDKKASQIQRVRVIETLWSCYDKWHITSHDYRKNKECCSSGIDDLVFYRPKYTTDDGTQCENIVEYLERNVNVQNHPRLNVIVQESKDRLAALKRRTAAQESQSPTYGF